MKIRFVALFVSLVTIGAIIYASGMNGGGGGGGGGGSAAWGGITGTLSDQTDLNTSLSAKQSTTLADGKILVGNGSNVATAVTPSGDVTVTNAGVTAIGATKVTNAMLAGSIAASKLVGTDIATVGTVTSGTWSGTAVGATKGGTGQTTVTQGDLLYGSAADTWSKLGAGTNGYFLKTQGAGANPTWAAVSPSFPLLGGNGTVSAPSYSFSSDTGTGMYCGSSVNHDLNFSSNGTSIAKISGSQTALDLQGHGLIMSDTGAGVSSMTNTGFNNAWAFVLGSNEFSFTANSKKTLAIDSQYVNIRTYPNGYIHIPNGAYATYLSTYGNAAAAGDQTLNSQTLAAYRLPENGDALDLHYAGSFAANGNTKQLKFKLGSTTLFDSGATAWNNKTWDLKIRIYRSGSASEKYSAVFTVSDGTMQQTYGTASEDLTTSLAAKCTGASGGSAANDIVQEISHFDLIRAGGGF